MINNWAYGVMTFCALYICGITFGVLTTVLISVRYKRKSKKKGKVRI